jgi:hypothetical protein
MHICNAHTDYGTVIGENDAAVIVSPDGTPRLLLPNYELGEEISISVAALISVAAKLQDEQWVRELVSECRA